MNKRILPNRDLWKRIKIAKKNKKKRILWKRAEAFVIAEKKYKAKKAKEVKKDYIKHRFLQSKINETIQRGFFSRNIPETENDDWWLVSFEDTSSLMFYGNFSGKNCDNCGNYITYIWCGITQIQCNCAIYEEVLFKTEDGSGYCPYTKSRDCDCENNFEETEKSMYEVLAYIVLIQKWWRKANKV
jgi:hypothetical protein